MKFLICCFLSITVFQSKAQQSTNTDTTTYNLKVKLVKAENYPPGCGVIAWALSQRFEIIESDYSILKPKYIVALIEPCPEFLGRYYFVTGKIYTVKVSKTSGAPFGYTITNESKNKNLFTLWIKEIKSEVPKLKDMEAII